MIFVPTQRESYNFPFRVKEIRHREVVLENPWCEVVFTLDSEASFRKFLAHYSVGSVLMLYQSTLALQN